GLYFLNDQDKCIQCFSVDTPVRKLLCYEEKNMLLTITNNLILTQHIVFAEGETKEIMKSNGSLDHKLYFWDVELDTVQYFNFETGCGEQDDYPSSVTTQENENDSNDAERGKNQAAKDIAGRYPNSMYWDITEPKLFVLSNTVDSSDMKKPSLTKIVEQGPAEVMMISLFCTSENGILIQDNFPMPSYFQRMMGVEVPYYYFTLKGEAKHNDLSSYCGQVNPETGAVTYPRRVARKIMHDFVGLENSDKATRDAMMNFSFYLCIGNMDEAFKAIKLIKRLIITLFCRAIG
ncbi:intraflagellar transport protein 140, partial [Biomphalaria glabrata]